MFEAISPWLRMGFRVGPTHCLCCQSALLLPLSLEIIHRIPDISNTHYICSVNVFYGDKIVQ